ncbi:MAG: hypothetical protein V1806_08535 [Pseudomonadota bacterium]
MLKETFAVGCAGVAFHNGVVMVDVTGLSTFESDANGRPITEIRERLIFTPEGFIATFNTMQGMMEKLAEVGLVKRNVAPEQNADAAAPKLKTETAANLTEQPKSPNF